jgi:hypothetical protein
VNFFVEVIALIHEALEKIHLPTMKNWKKFLPLCDLCLSHHGAGTVRCSRAELDGW